MAELNYYWEPAPHTADLSISIYATEKIGLYHAALDGLLGSMEIEKPENDDIEYTEYGLSINAGGIENALVDFLNECIYLMEVEDLIPVKIEPTETDSENIGLIIFCRPVKKSEIPQLGHIKAATYSDLNVVEDNGTFRATLVFDT